MLKVEDFTSHLSRIYCNFNIHQIENEYIKSIDNLPDSTASVLQDTTNENSFDPLLLLEDVESDETEPNSLKTKEMADQLLHNIMLFYLKLQAKYLIPKSTIDLIVQEMCNMHVLNQALVIASLKKALGTAGLQNETVREICSEVEKSDLFSTVHAEKNGPLRSDYSRQMYYKSKLKYVSPTQIFLGNSDVTQKPCYFHYVPSMKPLEMLLGIDFVRKQLISSIESEVNVVKKFTDGALFKRNELFNAEKEA